MVYLPTNPWMKKLQEKLAEEGILSDAEKARAVPAQYYAKSMSELMGQLKSFVKSGHREDKHLTVFVDGVQKQCSEQKGSDINKVFREALHEAGFSVDWVVLPDLLGISPADFHASHHLLEKTREAVRASKIQFCVVLGSGSITDMIKHALFLEGIRSPFLSVPTALTVTAFTSSLSVIDWHGAKRANVSREVSATFWLKSVLECAPHRMSRAGYGDIISRFLAYGDWYLGKRLGVIDSYNEGIYRLMEPFASGIKENADGFSQYPLPEETIQCIAASLAMAGIALSVSGEAAPLSGFEHVISHALDFLHLVSGRDLAFHGEQVALGCLTSVQAIDWLIDQEEISPDGWLKDPVSEGIAILNSLIDKAPLPPLGKKIERSRQEFIKEYEKKSLRWKGDLGAGKKDRFIKDWPEIRKYLAGITLRTTEMEQLIRRAGLPRSFMETVPPTSEHEYRWAVQFSPFIRSRMSISDLILWMGEDATRFIYRA